MSGKAPLSSRRFCFCGKAWIKLIEADLFCAIEHVECAIEIEPDRDFPLCRRIVSLATFEPVKAILEAQCPIDRERSFLLDTEDGRQVDTRSRTVIIASITWLNGEASVQIVVKRAG